MCAYRKYFHWKLLCILKFDTYGAEYGECARFDAIFFQWILHSFEHNCEFQPKALKRLNWKAMTGKSKNIRFATKFRRKSNVFLRIFLARLTRHSSLFSQNPMANQEAYIHSVESVQKKTRTNPIFSSVYVSDESVRASHVYERSVNLCKLHERMNMLTLTLIHCSAI